MIKRGLYHNLSVELGSPLEAALIFHETRTNSRDMIVAMAAAFGGKMKEPNKVMDQIQEMYLPGAADAKKRKHESDVAKIKAAAQFDWGAVLQMSAEQAAQVANRETMKSDPLLAHYVK